MTLLNRDPSKSIYLKQLKQRIKKVLAMTDFLSEMLNKIKRKKVNNVNIVQHLTCHDHESCKNRKKIGAFNAETSSKLSILEINKKNY